VVNSSTRLTPSLAAASPICSELGQCCLYELVACAEHGNGRRRINVTLTAGASASNSARVAIRQVIKPAIKDCRRGVSVHAGGGVSSRSAVEDCGGAARSSLFEPVRGVRWPRRSPAPKSRGRLEGRRGCRHRAKTGRS
jgi:hypothetical protein